MVANAGPLCAGAASSTSWARSVIACSSTTAVIPRPRTTPAIRGPHRDEKDGRTIDKPGGTWISCGIGTAAHDLAHADPGRAALHA
jgi:hypothetical protein